MRTPTTILTVLLLTLATASASAHAFLDHASPLVGSTVATAPHEVSLSFTQKLEPAFSSVRVTDESGVRVDRGEAQVSGNTIRVELKPLRPGTYRVRWHALSVDTHSTEGSFSFTVAGE